MPTYHFKVRDGIDDKAAVAAEFAIDAKNHAQAANFLRDSLFDSTAIGASDAFKLAGRGVPLLTAASAGEEPQPKLPLNDGSAQA